MDEDFPTPHLDPPELAAHPIWTASNVVVIEKQIYRIENWGEPFEDGSRTATLVPYDPEMPF